jgi:hypothetical protein
MPRLAKRPIVITTIATLPYLARLQEIGTLQYLENNHGAAGVALGTVGDYPDPVWVQHYPSIASYCIPGGMLDRGLGNPGNGCIQHGNWLPYLDCPRNATVICIDGDVKMQRPFSADEHAMLEQWQPGVIGIGPNEPKAGGDNMQNELVRIAPTLSHEDVWQRFYPDAQEPPPIGNAGCVVATRETWVNLWMCYLRTWLETARFFQHIAVQQWTFNLCINRHFTRFVLPQSFHTHGHWGYPGPPFDGWGMRNTATIDGDPILFAHKTW